METKRAIQNLLKINDLQYNMMLFDAGCEFFEARFGDWAEFEILKVSPVMWNWWKSIYIMQDAEWITTINNAKMKADFTRELMLDSYTFFHSSEKIIFSPGRVVLESAFPHFVKKQKVHI